MHPDFLWHHRGSLSIGFTASDAAVIGKIAGVLAQQRRTVVEQAEDHVTFNNPLWSDSDFPNLNWPPMRAYDRGRFWIEEGLYDRALCYDLRSLHRFVVISGIAIVFALVTLAHNSVAISLAVGLCAFGWFYGAGALLRHIWVPDSLRRALAEG